MEKLQHKGNTHLPTYSRTHLPTFYVPACPVAHVGDTVHKGNLIGAISEGQLGVNVHASITGKVPVVHPFYIDG